MKLSCVFYLIVFSLTVSTCKAADYPAPKEGDWVLHDFRFHTGDVLPELHLHYMTIGAPSGEPVLLLHGTGGDGNSFLTDSFAGELFGPGKPLDANRYFIILPDAIGHGKSSKPSDGLRTHFPHYDYDDMVVAQYRLLTEHLGITHVRMVLGISMGGMEVWLWGERYPAFMDALLPLAAEPAAMAGRNWMMRRMIIDAIRHDPDWHNGDYVKQPEAWNRALRNCDQWRRTCAIQREPYSRAGRRGGRPASRSGSGSSYRRK
jgi:homoserine O-acetyltransferase